MSNISASEKKDVLAEVFKLLSEQELSLRRILTTGENCECALRAKRINDLLEQFGWCADNLETSAGAVTFGAKS